MNRAELFGILPGPGRRVAATAWGMQLRWWRYSSATPGLVRDVLERDTWTASDWDRHREHVTGPALDHAARFVPYYRELWAKRRRGGDRRPSDELASWPVLEKEELRRQPEAFVAEDAPRRRYVDRTSGTSGTPLEIAFSRSALVRFYAAYEARVRRWHGVAMADGWAILGGQPVARGGQTTPPFWVENDALHQLYLSANHISPGTIDSYAAALRRFAPSHVVAYPSSIAALAQIARDGGVDLRGPSVVITNAEAISPVQRALVAEVFGCPVRATYGMAEMTAHASECGSGRMHAWPDVGIVELEEGRLVLTGLVNDVMPLVRYAVGDTATEEPDVPCSCGRTLPTLPTVSGRDQDLLLSADGQLVFWVNPIFYGLPILGAQVVQASDRSIIVRVLPDRILSEEVRSTVASRLRQRVGDLPVDVVAVAELERSANAKVRPVISQAT